MSKLPLPWQPLTFCPPSELCVSTVFLKRRNIFLFCKSDFTFMSLLC